MRVVITVHYLDDEKGDEDRDLVVGSFALDTVLHHFNPTADERVEMVKVLCAGVVQVMVDHRNDPNLSFAQAECARVAIEDIEGAQMRAVKSFFAKHHMQEK
jgi:hypothetical protein